jgi:exo-beta-1,3-glucanase (GH17 family)
MPSKNDTCQTQIQIAAQSSKIDTLITGKEVAYRPACQAPKVANATKS